MDNDNKVENSLVAIDKRHEEVRLFLNDELQLLQQGENQLAYDLEDEFAKTKKNHRWTVKIVLFISLALIVGAVVLVNLQVRKGNRSITIDINSFDDLNLKNVIDSYSAVQNDYESAVRKKTSLEAKMEGELVDAKAQQENEIMVLDALRLRDQADYNNRLNKINEDYNQFIAEIHKNYDEEIKIAEKEIEQFQKQMEQFDSAKLQAAQEQQRILDSERALFQIEQKKITDAYESRIADLEKTLSLARNRNNDDMKTAVSELSKKFEMDLALYDPVIQDYKGERIVTEAKNALANSEQDRFNKAGDFDVSSIVTEGEMEEDTLAKAFNEFQALQDSFVYLEDAFYGLPHKNSIVQYLKAIRILAGQMNSSLADASIEMYQQKKQAAEEYELQLTELQEQIQTLKEEAEVSQVESTAKLDETTKLLKRSEEKLAKAERDRKQEVALIQRKLDATEAMYEGMLQFAKYPAVILFSDSADNIIVYVSKNESDSITEAGKSAEIKSGKSVIKGKVIKKDNVFVFDAGVDKNGNPVEVDLSLIPPGTMIKIK